MGRGDGTLDYVHQQTFSKTPEFCNSWLTMNDFSFLQRSNFKKWNCIVKYFSSETHEGRVTKPLVMFCLLIEWRMQQCAMCSQKVTLFSLHFNRLSSLQIYSSFFQMHLVIAPTITTCFWTENSTEEEDRHRWQAWPERRFAWSDEVELFWEKSKLCDSCGKKNKATTK